MSTVETENLSIELAVAQNPAIVLVDKQKFNALYDHIQREVESFVPDLTTEAGRKAIASLAFKVARTKTAIDDAGKELNAQYREKINVVDLSRREIREKLDALKEQARKPLTDWEASEQKRQEVCRTTIDWLAGAAILQSGVTSVFAQKVLDQVEGRLLDPAEFRELHATAEMTRKTAIESLRASVIRMQQEEADRLELARLRAEAAEREAAEKKAAALAEAERKKKEAEEKARLSEEKRAADEAARTLRIQQEAENKAKLEAERVARETAEQRERQHAAEMNKLRIENERIESERRAEAKRIADEESARKAEADRQVAEAEKKAAEERRLAANKKHRTAIMTAAKVALMEHAGIEEEAARKVVLAISNEKIPAITMRFTS